MTDTLLITSSRTSVDETVRRLRDYFESGATRSPAFRLGALRRLRAALVAAEETLLAALAADLGKPPHEAYAAEIGLVLAEIDYATKHLKGWMKPKRRSSPWMVWPARARVASRPFGVALIMGPWNYPVQLVLLPLIGAVAAGNCAVVKPSELAPRTSEVLATVLAEAFDPQHVTCVQGDRTVAEALLGQQFDKVFFTGSTSVGRAVASAAARNLTPLTLEVGGKCPVIVCADANIRVAARRIVWAKTMNAGQTCVAPDYLLVERTVRDPLIEAIKAALHEMFGPDVQKSPHYGRVVNQRHFERLIGYLRDGSFIAGGQHDASDRFIAPTLLCDVSPDSTVMNEEIFGPILPVIPFDTLSDALHIVKNKPAPLAVYLFTSAREALRHIEHQIPCGGICVNDLVVQLFGKQLPFGGVGASGFGRYHGKASFDCFSYEQPVLECSTRFDPAFRYPPPRLPMSRFKRILPWLLRG